MKRPLCIAALTLATWFYGSAAAFGCGDLFSGLIAEFPGVAGVVVADPATGYRYAHEDGAIFPSASLYKLAVMLEAYRAARDGEISLDDTSATITAADLIEGGAVGEGAAPSVRELIELMITRSDNASAHALLRLLGPRAINATAETFGLHDTRLNTPLPAAERTAPFNTTTARDIEAFFEGLMAGSLVGPAESREMLEVLGRQRVNDRIPAALPPDTLVAHKTGNLDAIAHDGGVVWTPSGPRIVVVLTGGFEQYDDAVALARQVAVAAYALY
jgi:beta-lactamase class A